MADTRPIKLNWYLGKDIPVKAKGTSWIVTNERFEINESVRFHFATENRDERYS
jgi:hypothetical protein